MKQGEGGGAKGPALGRGGTSQLPQSLDQVCQRKGGSMPGPLGNSWERRRAKHQALGATQMLHLRSCKRYAGREKVEAQAEDDIRILCQGRGPCLPVILLASAADCRVSLLQCPFTVLVSEPCRCCPTPLGSLTGRSIFPEQTSLALLMIQVYGLYYPFAAAEASAIAPAVNCRRTGLYPAAPLLSALAYQV